MPDLVAQYRESAECRVRAEASKDEIEKARWLKMAGEWLTLAERLRRDEAPK